MKRAGVAGGNKGIPLPLRQHLQAKTHGRALFLPYHRQRGILHSHHLFGMQKGHVGKIQRQIPRRGNGTDHRFISHKDKVRTGELQGRPMCAEKLLQRCFISAHYIDDKFHKISFPYWLS